jgi:hypothetical protein
MSPLTATSRKEISALTTRHSCSEVFDTTTITTQRLSVWIYFQTLA